MDLVVEIIIQLLGIKKFEDVVRELVISLISQWLGTCVSTLRMERSSLQQTMIGREGYKDWRKRAVRLSTYAPARERERGAK